MPIYPRCCNLVFAYAYWDGFDIVCGHCGARSVNAGPIYLHGDKEEYPICQGIRGKRWNGPAPKPIFCESTKEG